VVGGTQVLRDVARVPLGHRHKGPAQDPLEPDGERAPPRSRALPDHSPGVRQPPEPARTHQLGDPQGEALTDGGVRCSDGAGPRPHPRQ
jgi:hypothetical protein